MDLFCYRKKSQEEIIQKIRERTFGNVPQKNEILYKKLYILWKASPFS